jgi:RNA polymerase sigma factor (TIGR02999 family)
VDDTARLLERLRDGDPQAAEALFALLYEDLRRIAGRLFRSQRRTHTLEPTALVHEAYLKMVGADRAQGYADRAHVLAVAARAMRQVLANHARDRAAQKRGGGADRERVTLAGVAGTGGAAVDAVAFHEALDRLAALDDRQARIAEMRLLGGLGVEEVAVLLGVSTRTVELDWRMAKQALAAWLAPATEGGSA